MPALVAASGVRHTLHDLRRSCRSLMARLDVAEEVAELAIGHVRRGLVGVYNKAPLWEQRIVAFDRVSEHISSLVTADMAPVGAAQAPAEAAAYSA
jgi:hypothetical protein